MYRSLDEPRNWLLGNFVAFEQVVIDSKIVQPQQHVAKTLLVGPIIMGFSGRD